MDITDDLGDGKIKKIQHHHHHHITLHGASTWSKVVSFSKSTRDRAIKILISDSFNDKA
jgi:hypothetical protein